MQTNDERGINMEWLVKLIKRLFSRKKTKLIEAPKNTFYREEKNRNDFVVMLKQNADLERSDGNGYGIIKNLSLKDMI